MPSDKTYLGLLLKLILFSTLISNSICTSRINWSLQSDHFYTVAESRHKHIDDFGPVKDIWGRKDLSTETIEIINSSTKQKDIRLPLEVDPVHYFLEIIPILDEDTNLGKIWSAPGNVRILVDALKPEKTITLHALLLNISDVRIIDRSSGENVTVLNHAYSESIRDQYVISLGEALVPGERYEIGIVFVAPVSLNRPDGLYRSHYIDPFTKKITYLVSTQLEFFHARQVFPCFDEPGVKSTFDISIGRSEKHASLSNSNLVSSVPLLGSFGWYIDTYNTTVIMPAYLVAFVVSDYTYVQAEKDILTNRPVRVYGPDYLINRGAGNFSADVSAKVLAFYEKYFDSEYPMPKMDSVVVPGFLHGAMENYGLNIYREVLLIDLPGVTTEQQRSRIANVIAHESAHQYFGNLVTCKWWDNVWLNEGFATYYSYIGQQATNPEYEPLKQFLIEGPQYGMALDSRERSSYPLLLNAKTQNGLESQAIGLPYYKGASLIRMMNGFLTPETFHKGIINYLAKWAYQPAEQDNLFEALTEQAHADGTLPKNTTVKEIMDPWTKQRGYPLVRVISTDDDKVYILYERFQSPNLARENKHSYWPIPVAIATEDDPNFSNHTPKFWIPEGAMVRTIKHDLSKWIVVNPEATGFYRVVYDYKLTQLIQQQLNKDHTVISPFSRSQILDDYFTLANQMDIPISTALEFTKYFAKETEDISWIIFLKNIRKLHFFYSETEANSPSPMFKAFRNYMIPRLEGALKKIGSEQLPGERGSKVTFRARLLNFACRLGSKMCLDYAGKLFEQWKSDTTVNPIPTDLRDFMYCYGVAAGGPRAFLFAFERYANETNLRQSLLQARSLGCVKEPEILEAFLESLLEGEGFFDKNSVQLLFEGVVSNPVGRPVVLNFLKKNMKEIKEHFNTTSSLIIRSIFGDLSDYLHTEEELMMFENVIEQHGEHVKDIRPFLSSYASDITDNINWMSKHYEPMRMWFEKQQEYSASQNGMDLIHVSTYPDPS